MEGGRFSRPSQASTLTPACRPPLPTSIRISLASSRLAASKMLLVWRPW